MTVNFHDNDAPPLTTSEKLEAAQVRIQELEEQLQDCKAERFGLHRFSTDPDMIKFYTGFTSYRLLISFFDSISPHAGNMIKWTQHQRLLLKHSKKTYSSFKNKLPLLDQLFMFLHKVRLGSLDQDLADKFGVSQSTVSRNTITWANFLYCFQPPLKV